MSRKSQAIKRIVIPDRVYGSKLVTMLINKVMKCGKKTIAEKIVYKSLFLIGEKTAEKPLIVFEKAIKNIIPLLELKSRRIGGSNYQVPIEVKTNRGILLSLRWLILAIRQKQNNKKTTIEKLVNEIIDASKGRGFAMKKRENIHKMARANKAFAHYRW